MRAPSRSTFLLRLSLLAALTLPPARGAAQETANPMPQREFRLDGTFGDAATTHLGAGLNVRAGWYARAGISLHAGATRGADDVWRGSQRIDATVRFLLDPFSERRRGWYGSAGVSAQHVAGRVTPVLVLVVGVEGRERRGVRPSLEAGLAGGVRVGLALRGARADR
jgi:hypothetical protein